MRYKLMLAVMVLLIGTPVFGQEFSPIVIHTGQPTPSVVRSGEPLKVVYRVEYFDTVVINEDQIQPENIKVDPFEAIKLEVVALPDSGSDELGIVHNKEFVYTLRIIKPEKGEVKIPAFNFYWAEKVAGTTETDAKDTGEMKEMLTDEVGVRYVYSPVKPPNLNIRDEIKFPFFAWSGSKLRNWGYGSIAVSFGLTLLLFIAWMWLGSSKSKKLKDKKSGVGQSAELLADEELFIPAKKARKKILRELKNLLNTKNYEIESYKTIENNVHNILRIYVLAELSETPIDVLRSDTPKEMLKRLTSLEGKSREELGLKFDYLVDIISRLDSYYDNIQSERPIEVSKLVSGIKSLLVAVVNKPPRKRFWKSLIDAFRRPNV